MRVGCRQEQKIKKRPPKRIAPPPRVQPIKFCKQPHRPEEEGLLRPVADCSVPATKQHFSWGWGSKRNENNLELISSLRVVPLVAANQPSSQSGDHPARRTNYFYLLRSDSIRIYRRKKQPPKFKGFPVKARFLLPPGGVLMMEPRRTAEKILRVQLIAVSAGDRELRQVVIIIITVKRAVN